MLRLQNLDLWHFLCLFMYIFVKVCLWSHKKVHVDSVQYCSIILQYLIPTSPIPCFYCHDPHTQFDLFVGLSRDISDHTLCHCAMNQPTGYFLCTPVCMQSVHNWLMWWLWPLLPISSSENSVLKWKPVHADAVWLAVVVFFLGFFYLVGTYYIRGKDTSSTGVVRHKKNTSLLCGWVVLAKTTSANWVSCHLLTIDWQYLGEWWSLQCKQDPVRK